MGDQQHMVSVVSNCATNSSILQAAARRGRDEVYVGAVPLRATKGPAQLIMSAAYSLHLWDLQHFMVIINPSSSSPLSQHNKPLAFDFQPQDPDNIYVALAALSGRKIPGVLLTRKLSKLPTRKCWLVGHSRMDAVEATCKFNENWQTDLSIGTHDCRNYTNGLVEYLTGEKCVLESLRNKLM